MRTNFLKKSRRDNRAGRQLSRVLAAFMTLVIFATGSVFAAGDNKIYRGEILFLAHKGYSAAAPENTLPAIREAVRAGFGGAEIDVYESKKEKGKGYKPYIIVSHDKTLTRLTGKKANVKNLTHVTKNYYPVVANVNGLSKYGKQYMPTLEEALSTAWYEAARCHNPNFVVEIEIKGTMSKAGLKKLSDWSESTMSVLRRPNTESRKKIKKIPQV